MFTFITKTPDTFTVEGYNNCNIQFYKLSLSYAKLMSLLS